jgi:hypothetical protein
MSRVRVLALCLIAAGVAWLVGGPLAGWVRPVALAALVGAAALLLVGRRMRPVISAIVALAGIAMLAGGAAGLGHSAWRSLVTLACGLAVAAGGSVALVAGRSWAAPGTRYERSSADARSEASAKPSSKDVWDALDRGDDLTR